jgi:phage-related minor tail protein
MAKIVGDEDIKRGEIAIKLMKERILYAEDLRGTMDAIGVADPEMDLAEGMADLERVREIMKGISLQTLEAKEKTRALTDLYATVFRGEDGVIADMTGVAINAFHGMTDALTDFVMTGKKNFTEFANSVIADIMRIAIRQTIVQPIAQGLMGAFGLSAPVAAMASGGPVFGGSSYLVGERGPELFTPSSSGSITPNGGGNVTVNVQNNTGQPIEKKNVRTSFDAQGMVIDMVIDAVNRDVHGARGFFGGR